MEPELYSVILKEVIGDNSVVKITYKSSEELVGIELMGVDAGLSWIKGESLEGTRRTEDGVILFDFYLILEETCEFRARGYDSEGNDYWETGLKNNALRRNPDGTISFESEADAGEYIFKGDLPPQYDVKPEIARSQLMDLDNQDISIFQVFIDLSVWVDELIEHPLDEEYIYPISRIMYHLRVKMREIKSHKLDEVGRPVLIALFNMYKSALEFAEDDIRLLVGEWEQKGYISTLKNLPEKVKQLDDDERLGRDKDRANRIRELIRYLS